MRDEERLMRDEERLMRDEEGLMSPHELKLIASSRDVDTYR